jgi:hypothetical protein
MIFNIKRSVGSRGSIVTEDSFTFTGDYLFARDDDGHFELALLESGTLAWNSLPPSVDVFLVADGGNGEASHYDSYWDYSGAGGDAGRHLTVENVQLGASCAAVIGNDTTITSEGTTYTSANGVAPNAGGQGAKLGANQTAQVNTAGADGVYAYDRYSDETLIPALAGMLFCASGGGGHAVSSGYVRTTAKGGHNEGGATNAGAGGTESHYKGYDATGYGNGGGGAYADGVNEYGFQGGAGSGGIILIRDHR